MTFSLIARDDRHLGVATASRSLAVGAIVPWARAGIGVVATQAFTSPRIAAHGLDGLASGTRPAQLLESLLAADPSPELRQVAILDAAGRVAHHTGNRCVPAAAAMEVSDAIAIGNMLTSSEVVRRMLEAWQATPGSVAERLVRALLAGEEAGGDARGRQAAALKVVERHVLHPTAEGVAADLRVDDHPGPIGELARLLGLLPTG